MRILRETRPSMASALQQKGPSALASNKNLPFIAKDEESLIPI